NKSDRYFTLPYGSCYLNFMKWLASRLASVAILTLVLNAAVADLAPIHILRIPEGGLQPQVIMDSKAALHLIYLKGEPRACDVFYVRRESGKTNFSVPLRVNSQPGSGIAIGTVRGEQLALGRNGRIYVAWNGSSATEPKSADGSPMLYARLNDAGTAFEPQRN